MTKFKTLLATALCALTIAPVRANEPAYLINQNLSAEGPVRIIASARGGRVQMPHLDIYLPMSQQEAYVYNRQNRKFCVLNRSTWVGKLGPSVTINNIKVNRVAKYAAHQSTQYFADAFDAKGVPKFKLEFWTAKDFSVPAKVADDYSRLLGLPAGYGMPLCVIRHYPDGKQMVFLSTYEAKPSTLNAAELVPPASGFQRAEDEMDVLIGD